MKIFLDDVRTPPPGWQLVKWPQEVIVLLKTGLVTHVSLDHDLGNDNRGTGYDVILWIEQEVVCNNFLPPVITVHSSNVSARNKMELGIKSIYRLSQYSA